MALSPTIMEEPSCRLQRPGHHCVSLSLEENPDHKGKTPKSTLGKAQEAGNLP